MISLVLAAAFFVGIHLFISGTRLRGVLVEWLGEGPYRGLFSLLSLVGIVWMSVAYSSAPLVELWGDGDWFQPPAQVLMVCAFLLVGIGLTTPNPTSVGAEGLLEQEVPATGILRITRHPFLTGVAVWALVHVVFNGDAASLLFFGALGVLAIAGPFSIDRKRARASGDAWQRFAAVTSRLPFLAIAQGRNSLAFGELGWWRIALGVALYALFLWIHPWLFGGSALGR